MIREYLMQNRNLESLEISSRPENTSVPANHPHHPISTFGRERSLNSAEKAQQRATDRQELSALYFSHNSSSSNSSLRTISPGRPVFFRPRKGKVLPKQVYFSVFFASGCMHVFSSSCRSVSVSFLRLLLSCTPCAAYQSGVHKTLIN